EAFTGLKLQDLLLEDLHREVGKDGDLRGGEAQERGASKLIETVEPIDLGHRGGRKLEETVDERGAGGTPSRLSVGLGEEVTVRKGEVERSLGAGWRYDQHLSQNDADNERSGQDPAQPDTPPRL